eukprot:CAMPEP_0170888014 /NCGR_PEP_ID=MMETSP0734-20130129/38110_1 /TAXON_ID=186038 /ORGANISM="Fragilariopsis kerguelensis, Strain L26-C5" /LENGTH=675 /DNA_ID=CAMNT_0011275311 /DNA_START=644 /DNA_END=2674 /DNA_ORIENTATION=-
MGTDYVPTASRITTISISPINIQREDNHPDEDDPTDYYPCFPTHLNSKLWLESKRLGNNDNDNNHNDSSRFDIDNGYVKTSILKIESLLSSSNNNNNNNDHADDHVDVDDEEINSQNILRHTVCTRTSKFLTLKFSSSINDDNDANTRNVLYNTSSNAITTIQQLSFRLLYLSVHVHQHRHAVKEAGYRLQNAASDKNEKRCEQEMKTRNIGKFDFECRDAKFLVVPLKQSGLGAQLRLVAAPALIAGIASDRIVLFVNGSPVGPKFIREPWILSSCPRRDKQCFFLPDSPCVVTHSEIENATTIGKSERRLLFKTTGQLPIHIQNDRVVVMNMAGRPQRIPTNFRNRIAHIAKEYIINPLLKVNPTDRRLPLLFAAVDNILEVEDESVGDDDDKDLFYYYGRNSQAHHAMVFFAMRPNFIFSQRIDENIDLIIFKGKGTDDDNNNSNSNSKHRADFALGLPIRASDKCIDESECPSFEMYMELIQSMWNKNENNLLNIRQEIAMLSNTEEKLLKTSIILTSESPDILQAQKIFQQHQGGNGSSNNSLLSFPFKFVTNKFDVLQNTGDPSAMTTSSSSSNSSSSKEEILLSAITSLKMQLYAKYNTGNCCSNHHLLLFDFLEGCGGGDHIATCMQNHEDEKFRICCGWTKTEICVTKRSEREAVQNMLIKNMTRS